MPIGGSVAYEASKLFSVENVRSLQGVEWLRPGVSLLESIEQAGLLASLDEDVAAGIRELLGGFPDGPGQAIVAAVRSAVDRGVPVTFAWAPAYDYEVTVWEASAPSRGDAAVTIMLRTRYPDDLRAR